MVGGGVVYAKGDGRDGVFGELRVDSGEGVVDPSYDGGVPVLAHRVVVGAGGEEGDGRVDVAEVEDVVR